MTEVHETKTEPRTAYSLDCTLLEACSCEVLRSGLSGAARVGERRTLGEMGPQVYEIDESLGRTFRIRLATDEDE
jgi:hypothetical protein